jgi:hypothetical protein
MVLSHITCKIVWILTFKMITFTICIGIPSKIFLWVKLIYKKETFQNRSKLVCHEMNFCASRKVIKDLNSKTKGSF